MCDQPLAAASPFPSYSGWGLSLATDSQVAATLKIQWQLLRSGPFSEQRTGYRLLVGPHWSANCTPVFFSVFTWKMYLLQEHLESVQKEFIIFNRDK